MPAILGSALQAFRDAGAHLPGNALRVTAARLCGVRVGRGARLGRGVKLSQGTSIGRGCRIGRDAVLDDVQLAAGCTVGEAARLARLVAGEGSHIETRVVCIGARRHRITIGRHCYVGVAALLDYSSDITLGDYVHIAGPTAALHTHSSVRMALNGCALDQDRRQYGAIQIGSRSWIGGNATIYPGRTIGERCVVLPNSVVSSDVESYTMVGGVPAEVVRLIEREEQRGPAGEDSIPPARARS